MLTAKKNRKVPKPPQALSIGGVHITTAKLKPQLVIVEMALALVRMALGEISAG